MKKKELFSQFDEIDDFSYIDTPTVALSIS